RFNDRHETDFEFDSSLATKVIEKIIQRPIDLVTPEDRVQPSILQLVLTRWWDRQMVLKDRVFRLEVLENMGGIRNIVGDHVRETLKKAGAVVKPHNAALVFVPLVTESGRKIANTNREIAGSTGLEFAEVSGITLLLERERILREVPLPPKAEVGDRCYEFAH